MGTIVQLVSLLYKDRPVENILAMFDVKECANLASTSESAFDNEEDQYGSPIIGLIEIMNKLNVYFKTSSMQKNLVGKVRPVAFTRRIQMHR